MIVFKINKQIVVLFYFFQQSTIVGLFSSIGNLFAKVSNDEVSSKLLYIYIHGPKLHKKCKTPKINLLFLACDAQPVFPICHPFFSCQYNFYIFM